MRALSPAGLHAVLILGAAFSVLARAEGQEYCVTCTEPSAVYRCIIEGAKPGGAQPLQMFCTTAMAKMGRHATCSVKGGTVFDCDGQVKRIPWSAQPAPQPGPSQETGKRPAGPDPVQPPQTVEEMARRANQKTAEQLSDANEKLKDKAKSLGENLGEATRKTWRCVASLFTRCFE